MHFFKQSHMATIGDNPKCSSSLFQRFSASFMVKFPWTSHGHHDEFRRIQSEREGEEVHPSSCGLAMPAVFVNELSDVSFYIHILTCPHMCMYNIFHSKFIVCRSSSSFLEDQHITSPYFVLLPSRTQTQIWKILRNPDDLDIYAIINVIFQRVSFWQLTSCTLYISISPIGYQCTIPSYSSQIPLYP